MGGKLNKSVLLRVLSLFVTVFFVLSCEKDGDMGGKGGYPVALSVCVRDNALFETGAKSATKAVLGANNTVSWESGDQISLLALSELGNYGSAVLDLMSDSDYSVGKFEGQVDVDQEPDVCYFGYSGGDDNLSLAYNNGVVTASFDYTRQTGAHKPFLYGGAAYSTDGINSTLHHIGGMLRIKLPDAVTIKKVTVLGNNGEVLSPISVNLSINGSGDCNAVPVSNSATAKSFEVNLESASIEEVSGSYYCYISMPPVEFEKGFSLIFNNGSSDMYKSYNYVAEGGCDFSKEPTEGSPATAQTLKGAIVDIDASTFTGYSFSASLSASHTFAVEAGSSQEVLTGTTVKLANATMAGYPASVVTQWGVELYNGSGEIVRSINYTNAGGDANYTKPGDVNNISMAVENNWPYLPQGAYTVKPYVKTIYSGDKHYGSNLTLTVPVLDASRLKPTVNAVTSYSYYLAGDMTNANREGTGSSIYNISAGINISSAILNNTKYTVTATVTDKTTSGNSSVSDKLTSSSGQILRAQYDVADWKAYQLASTVNFDGVTTAEATTTVHVTGLPYKVAPPKNSGSHPWVSEAGNNTWNNNYVELYYSAAKYPTISSPAFHIPADINVSLATKIVRNKYTFLGGSIHGPIQIFQKNGSGNDVFLVNQDLKSEAALENTYNATMMASYTHKWYIEYHYTATGPRTYVYYFNLSYSK